MFSDDSAAKTSTTDIVVVSIEVRLLLWDNIEINPNKTQYQDVGWIQLVQEHGNKSSRPIKGEEFLHQLKENKQILKGSDDGV
jgi:hypothetical protein